MHLKPTPNHPFYFIVCIKLWSGGKKEDFWLNMQVYEVVVAKMQHLSVKNVWTKTIISVCTSLFLSKWWSSSLGYNTIFQMWIHGKFHQIWQEMVIGSCLLINSSFFFILEIVCPTIPCILHLWRSNFKILIFPVF